MTTNKIIPKDSMMAEKAEALLLAAREYWEIYRTELGSGSAVVWIEADNGHFVLFTRGEYKDAIMSAASRECGGEVALFEPFGPDGKEIKEI